MTRNNKSHRVGQFFLLSLELKQELSDKQKRRTRTKTRARHANRQTNSIELVLDQELQTAWNHN